MKICFFNRSYWPDQAATGQLLTELAEDLVNRHGCEVTVVAGRALHGASADGVRLWPVRRESHQGVAIVRANGTRFRPRRFSGRAANYVTYFASSTIASLVVSRPDVVVSLTDPPIVGLTALSTRSEEHTSELQSPCNLVCRLLLEKKKKNHLKYLRHELV